jgi:hypothetical protein
VVAGNHEFNAVAYATSSGRGGHLRERSPKNEAQHAAFIAAVGLDSALQRELVAWFTTLPLWLELDGLRVIHACWSDAEIEYLRPLVSGQDSLTEQLVVDASTEAHPAYDAIETLLKGPEVDLPNGMSFHDKGNHRRRRARLTWWDDSATNWRDLLGPDEPVFDADGDPVDALPDEPIPTHLSKRYTGDVPVIFGHYWFRAPLEVTNPLALCVDYSAGAGGPLAAYRFDGEPGLRADHLVRF